MLHLPFHKATAEEAKEFWDWANQPWNGGQREKIKTMRVQVGCDIENAIQFPPVRAGEDSPVSVRAFLPGKQPLRIVPMLNADHKGRVTLTYMGQDDDSRLYVALMSLSYGKPYGWVRECETCKKGFVASHGRDRFCSTLCRVKWHTQTKEGKRKRAEYMRGHRATLRARERKGILEGKPAKSAKRILSNLGK